MSQVQNQLGCPACGREVRGRDKKCPWCGNNLRTNRPLRAGKRSRFSIPGPLILAACGTLLFFVIRLLVLDGAVTSELYFGTWVLWTVAGAVVCLLVKAHHEGGWGILEWFAIGSPIWDDVTDSWWLGFAAPTIAAIAFLLIR